MAILKKGFTLRGATGVWGAVWRDALYRAGLWTLSGVLLLLCAGVLLSLVGGSAEALGEYGFWGFLSSVEWNPTAGREVYGALPYVVGTIGTSLLALALCVPLALPVAILTGFYAKGRRLSVVVTTVVDLLAGVPSIVYGLWGFYAVRPLVISLGINWQGLGVFTASVVLAIMVVPYAASLCREFLALVPASLSEAAYSLGATRLETLRYVVMPVARRGLVAGFVLALGRALGETMAVTMLIGNTNNLPTSLRDTGNTLASVIANQFGEAQGLRLSALMLMGLLLFAITVLVNLLAKVIMRKGR